MQGKFLMPFILPEQCPRAILRECCFLYWPNEALKPQDGCLCVSKQPEKVPPHSFVYSCPSHSTSQPHHDLRAISGDDHQVHPLIQPKVTTMNVRPVSLSRFLAIHAAGILFLPLPSPLGKPAVHVRVVYLSSLHPSIVAFDSTTWARTDPRINKSSVDLLRTCVLTRIPRQYPRSFLQSDLPSVSKTSDE